MVQRIEIIAGGYEVISDKKFISTQNLVPFGSFHTFPNPEIKTKVNLKKEFVDNSGKIKSLAEKYASSTKAPFYELEISQRTIPYEPFCKNHVLLFEKGQIQLYVENKKD